jgi:hypothetical protein
MSTGKRKAHNARHHETDTISLSLRVTNSVTITPEFDVDGNMTEYGDWSFAWDGENRLVEVASNSVTVVEHGCDYMGRRIKKIAGSETTTFIYDGWNMIRETIDDGVSQSANHYVWGLDLSGRRGRRGVGPQDSLVHQ